jgi:hypothetical protein
MALPSGWIANVRPGEALTSYTGDQTANWIAGASGTKSAQPKTSGNPLGQQPGVPAMGITAELAAFLEGPQPSR